MLKRSVGWGYVLIVVIYCITTNIPGAHAETPLSAHYRFDESSLGAGGVVQSASNNYQSLNAISDLAGGNSTSSNYQVDSGSKTTSDPTLSFAVNQPGAFNDFTSAAPAMTTSTFSVLDYTSYGYVVQIVGTTPTNGGHSIPAMATNDISRVGTEQFGINLVANTTPLSVGANPDNGQFGFGAIATNYNTGGSFRYVSGETIAQSPKSSGVTNYTISYLVNVQGLTPGGSYASNQTIVVTGTY